jgi:hypothetical protein
MSGVRSTPLRDARSGRRYSTMPKLQSCCHHFKPFCFISVTPAFAAPVTARPTIATASKSKSSLSPKAIVSAALILGIPILVVMCVNNVSKESERRATELIAAEQRENQEAVKNRHVLIGMTTTQVRQAWGEPKRIIRTMTARAEHKEWIYGHASLYFVNGVLKSGTKDDGK